MQKLLTLGPAEIQTSVYPGNVEAASPLWKEGINVAFRDMGLRNVKGKSPMLAPYELASPVKQALQGFSAGKQRLFLGTSAGVRMIERNVGVTTESDLGAWTTATNHVSLENWGNWLVASNGINPVQVWKNTGTMAALSGTPFTWAKIIKRKGPYLLAFNNSLGEDRVDWSHTSDIENWAVTSETEGGNFVIRDLDSNIVAVSDLGERLAVYSGASLVLGSLIGRPNVFGWRKVLSGIGAVSHRSVVAQGPFNYGLTANGIFKTDGNSYQWIDDPAAQRWIIDNVDWDERDAIFGYHDDFLRLLTWHFIDNQGEKKSVSYHYDGGQFVFGNLPAIAAAPRDSWTYPIVVDEDNIPGFWQQGPEFMTDRPEYYVRTKPLDFGSRDYTKIVNLIRVDGEWTSGVKLRVGATDDPEAEPEWYHDEDLVQKNYFPEERDVTYHVIEISGTEDFHITGIEFFGVGGGVQL